MRKLTYCLFTFFALSILSCATHAQKGKVILAIFAHADDEETVTPVLAKYAAEGAIIYVAIATDGRYGASEHFGVDDPDSLAAIRKEELICVTKKLGINPPIVFGLHDQLKMQQGMDTMSVQLNLMREKVTALFDQLKPDVVITWGPSGVSGHPDHRMVSNVVTDVYSAQRWKKPSRLYYTELVSGSIPKDNTELITVDSVFLNVRIPVSQKDIEKARLAWGCYKSQYTAETEREWQDIFWTSQKGISYFRSFDFQKGIQTTLFP